jgi:hypothetical protein
MDLYIIKSDLFMNDQMVHNKRTAEAPEKIFSEDVRSNGINSKKPNWVKSVWVVLYVIDQ